jgi:myo-inositol-1(or 4)-monophosphatase
MASHPSSNGDLRIAVTAALAAGEFLQSEFTKDQRVLDDTARDVKLHADVMAERKVLDVLRNESFHPVLSEEQGADDELDTTGSYWVVDPLDGTFNFSRRIPFCAVSIALWRAMEPSVGVVHDFMAGRTYAAVVGEGAWLDATLLSVGRTSSIRTASLFTGFPAGRDFDDDAMSAFVKKAQSYKKLRLIGSASLSLAFVANGTADLYYEEDIYFWDVAAGLALVKAAGGGYRLEPGSSRWQFKVLAGNDDLLRATKIA